MFIPINMESLKLVVLIVINLQFFICSSGGSPHFHRLVISSPV
nr:MAG TPA: hypothetical protein [Bacteriophage sp.]